MACNTRDKRRHCMWSLHRGLPRRPGPRSHRTDWRNNQSTNQSANQSISQSITQSANLSISHRVSQSQNTECGTIGKLQSYTCYPNRKIDRSPWSRSGVEIASTIQNRGIVHVCCWNDSLLLEIVLAPLSMLSNGDICCFPSPSYCEYMGFFAPIWEMDVLLDTLRSPNSLLLWCPQPSWDPFRPIHHSVNVSKSSQKTKNRSKQSYFVPALERLAQLECVQLFFPLTSWPSVAQQTEMFLCEFAKSKTSLLLRPLDNSLLQSYGTAYVLI